MAVHLDVERSIAARTILDLTNEAAQLWRPYHVHLAWAAEAPAVPAPGVVLEAILARQITVADRRAGATVLGFTSLAANGAGGGPIHVSLNAIRDLLTHSARRTNVPVFSHDLARALGRVLAHEIGHRLLGVPWHDRSGLMRPAFGPDDLREPGRQHFKLTPIGLRQLDRRFPQLRGDRRMLKGPTGCEADQEQTGAVSVPWDGSNGSERLTQPRDFSRLSLGGRPTFDETHLDDHWRTGCPCQLQMVPVPLWPGRDPAEP